MLKTIDGHSKSVGRCQDYLEVGSEGGISAYVEKDGRAAAQEFIGIKKKSNWAREMDAIRNHLNKNEGVTFYHFVLSPDPRDKARVEDVAAYAKEWAVECFGKDIQAAITVHNDTSNPHAHIVVNNINFATGKKLCRTLSDSRREAKLAQQIGVKYGYRPLPNLGISQENTIEKDIAKTPNRTSPERGGVEWRIEAKGYISWKAQIREAVYETLQSNPRSFAEYKHQLRGFGYDVVETKRGGYTYKAASGLRCKGEKLGLNFEPSLLIPVFRDNLKSAPDDLSLAECLSVTKQQLLDSEIKDRYFFAAKDLESRAEAVSNLMKQDTKDINVLKERLSSEQSKLAQTSCQALDKARELKAINKGLDECYKFKALGQKIEAISRVAMLMDTNNREVYLETYRDDITRYEGFSKAYEMRPDLSQEVLEVAKNKVEIELEMLQAKNIDSLDSVSQIESAIGEIERFNGQERGDYWREKPKEVQGIEELLRECKERKEAQPKLDVSKAIKEIKENKRDLYEKLGGSAGETIKEGILRRLKETGIDEKALHAKSEKPRSSRTDIDKGIER